MGNDHLLFDRLAKNAIARCDTLGEISEESGRLTRRPLTRAARVAEDRVAGWLTTAGCVVTRDGVGNVFGRWSSLRTTSHDAQLLVIGSHLDSVRDGGRFDGPLGVMVGLGLLEYLGRPDAPALPFDVEVVAFSGEEGTRFSTPFLGSAVATGSAPLSWLDRADETGMSLRVAIENADSDAATVIPGTPRYQAGSVLAYLETHIEQGPVLDLACQPIGVVSGIVGQSRLFVQMTGRANHAGTTPMGARRDAVAGAAETILAVERIANATPGMVATVGEIVVTPGSANVIPGSATFSLDLRHADETTRRFGTEAILAEAEAIAERRSLRCATMPAMDAVATPCSPDVIRLIQDAASTSGIDLPEVVSGAGHDAMSMATVAPIGMIFVRSPGGVSHHPDEAVRVEDVADAMRLLAVTVDRLATLVRTGAWARTDVRDDGSTREREATAEATDYAEGARPSADRSHRDRVLGTPTRELGGAR